MLKLKGFLNNKNKNIDKLVPFLVNETNIRGKLVTLNKSLNAILNQHGYNDFISKILAECLIIVTMLGHNLKNEDGMITIQFRSENGPIKLIVVNYFNNGKIRGYASYDAELLDKHLTDSVNSLPNPINLMYPGNIVLTVDNGGKQGLYQGIIALEGSSITESFQRYFLHSEQILTSMKIAVGKILIKDKEEWLASGIMIQQLPDLVANNNQDDNWDRSSAFINTIKDVELLDPFISSNDLLYKLFHEDGVWLYSMCDIEHRCRCSREKSENILQLLSPEELQSIKINDNIIVTCEFCNKQEHFRTT